MLPCICHSVDVKNLIFGEEDYYKLVHNDKTVYLFNGCADDNEYAQKYIHLGVELEINKRYLTASRNPWYALENRKPSPIWVSVFNRDGLRFVRNKAGVYNLTTFHCVYCNGIIDTDVLFVYLITDMAKEIFLDNSRQYGNGLIKFEPNDLNKGSVVDLRLLSDEEKKFIKTIYSKLSYCENDYGPFVQIINDFFKQKYTNGLVKIDQYYDSLRKFDCIFERKETKKIIKRRFVQLNFLELYEHYSDSPIIENCIVQDNGFDDFHTILYNELSLYSSKNVLISLVKDDNVEQYLNHDAKLYYTGKRFPSTIDLNKLYFFMPYIKGKGIRDLYLIKIARVGYHKEGQPDNDVSDLRLVFEIEYIGELFMNYKPVELKIWHTFTDTTIGSLLKQN